MLNEKEKIKTIQSHLEKVGSRYLLATMVMARTNQLINGAPIKHGLSKEFNPGREEIPFCRLPKIALEEIRTGKLTWKHVSNENEAPPEIESPVFHE